MENYSVIDVFCGIGGLTHGFYLEKFNIIAGIDSDSSCRYAYEVNNGTAQFVAKKVEGLKYGEVSQLYPCGKGRILVGCAPCQPYSSNNTKRPETDKWKLLDHFANLVDEVQPVVWSMENVLQLKTFDNGRVYNCFIKRLKEMGYFISSYRAFCPEYGIPQRRRRLVMFGSKYVKVQLIKGQYSEETCPKVKDYIGDLEELSAGSVSVYDRLHAASNLSELNIKRIRSSKPNGTWQDWDEKLKLKCHQKGKGKTALSVYGRMAWDNLSPTLTTQFHNYGSGRYGHPEQDRAISLREGALLQTFPKDYQFIQENDKANFTRLGRHIGNAVPVELGRAIAQSIRLHLENR